MNEHMTNPTIPHDNPHNHLLVTGSTIWLTLSPPSPPSSWPHDYTQEKVMTGQFRTPEMFLEMC